MKIIYAFLIIIAFISFGCGGKGNVKPSADSVIAQNVLRTAEIIKDAYQKKDEATIHENMEPTLSKEISKSLSFENAKLSFASRMVKIRASDIMVHLNWRGEWTINGKILKDMGVSTLVFQRETTKLIRIDGDNPFLIPSSSD